MRTVWAPVGVPGWSAHRRRLAPAGYPFRGWIWCVQDSEALLVVPLVSLYDLNGACWGHGDGYQTIVKYQSVEKIHCCAIGFRFNPSPEQVQFKRLTMWISSSSEIRVTLCRCEGLLRLVASNLIASLYSHIDHVLKLWAFGIRGILFS